MMYLFLCFLRVYSMCEGLRSPLLSADFLSFPLLSSPLLASPLPRHLPILSFSATNPSFHSAALLYTPSAARHYTPSAALLNTGTTLLSPPPLFTQAYPNAPALHAAPSHLSPSSAYGSISASPASACVPHQLLPLGPAFGAPT